jgi:hypothetical protein
MFNNLTFEEWKSKHYNEKIVDLKEYLSAYDIRLIKKLKIEIKNKIYTEYEFEILQMELLSYYDDENMSIEERFVQKQLKGITRKNYNRIVKIFEKIADDIYFKLYI